MKTDNLTITRKEYRNLLTIAYTAKSAYDYSIIEGNTFDFMVDKNLEAVNEEFNHWESKDGEKLSYGDWLDVNGFVKFSNLLYKKDNEEWFLAKVITEYNAYAESF